MIKYFDTIAQSQKSEINSDVCEEEKHPKPKKRDLFHVLLYAIHSTECPVFYQEPWVWNKVWIESEYL